MEALLAGSPELQNLSSLARRFRIMVRERRADELDRWLTAAAGSAMAGFGAGIRRDLAPVRAALTLSWSTGPVEGQKHYGDRHHSGTYRVGIPKPIYTSL